MKKLSAPPPSRDEQKRQLIARAYTRWEAQRKAEQKK